MSKLIIMTGDLATGKTTFSQALSKRYNVEAYNKDTIKEILADNIGFKNREDNLKLSHAAIALMTEIFVKHSSNGVDLILEANFHKDEITRLYEIAKENGAEVLTLVFEADIDVLYERFRYRIEYENRHPVHQSAGLKDIKAFNEYVMNSRKDVTLPDYIKVCANDFSYQTDAELLDKIDKFYYGK